MIFEKRLFRFKTSMRVELGMVHTVLCTREFVLLVFLPIESFAKRQTALWAMCQYLFMKKFCRKDGCALVKLEETHVRTTRLLLVVLIALLLAADLAAQNQHPNQVRGFNSNGVYSSFGIDHINTFNGNLVVTIPIGQNYPVNGGLSYSLKLVYNSNVWSPREVCPDTVDLTQMSSTLLSVIGRVIGHAHGGDPVIHTEGTHVLGNRFDDIYLPLPARVNPDQCWTIQDPNPAANAGLGWQVSLGKIYQPRPSAFDERPQYTEKSDWVYMMPDGSEHTFYPTLHVGDPVGSANIWYTRNGSYLRLNLNSPDPAKGNMMIEFPDGQKHYFTPIKIRNAEPNQTPEIVEEKLSRIEDPFGNFVSLQYLDTDGNGLKDDVWIISDSVGRTQILSFASQAPGYPKSITDVALEAFGNQPDTHYTFGYDAMSIRRPVPHVPPGYVFGYTDDVNVAFLKEINLPDGSQYSMPVASSYSLPTGDHYSPGVLQKVTLPTGGRLQWLYESEDPAGDLAAGIGYRFGVPSSSRHYLRSAFGVRRRIVSEGPSGNPRTYTWKYDPKLGANFPSGCSPATAANSCSPAEFVNTVTTPEGDHIRYYFSVWPFPYDSDGLERLRRGLAEPHSADYGLPFTKDPRRFDAGHDPANKTYIDAGGNPLFLSEAIYDSGWNLKRSTYVRYESDLIDQGDGFGSMRDANTRVVASRTVYDDDTNGKYAEVIYSDFDGLGHYRRSTTSGNFGAGDNRTELTGYNRDPDGTYHVYSVDPATNEPSSIHNYVPFGEGRAWLLNTYDVKSASEFSKQSTTYFKFDERGLLLAQRTRKNFDPPGSVDVLGDSDVLVRYGYDPNGNLTSERYFGGDRLNHFRLNTSNKFPEPNASNSEYQIAYGYQCAAGGGASGTTNVVSTRNYIGANFKSTDDTIDCRTGLVISSRDSAGVQTAYDYDNMGRAITITRQQGNTDHVKYEAAAGGALPKATLTRSDRNNTTPPFAPLFGQETYIYDQLGRLITEKRLLPSGDFQSRSTSYNGSGWITASSEWVAEGTTSLAGKQTTYENFDPFGRPSRIVLPDNTGGDSGNHHVIQMGYLGAREKSRTVRVARQIDTSGNLTEVEAMTKETYDRQGRLVQVMEPAGETGQTTTWDYSYNVNNQMTGATLKSAVGQVVQTRSFVYDNLGNLLTQVLPERTGSQAGEYDTMGNPGKTYDGKHWLSNVYDVAGRPTSVNELVEAAGTWRPIKEFSYYAANGGPGGTFAQGKLQASTRHNYVLNPYEFHQNLAQGKVATQSPTVAGALASRAVDGNTNGNFFNNPPSVTHTDYINQAWWQVDLGASYALDQVNLWNRTDCCPERLSNFYVLVSDNPFIAGDSLDQARNRPGVSSYYFGGIAASPTTIPVGRNGRYVRVQLAGANYLSLAEVQVIGTNTAIYDIAVTERYMYSGVDGRMSKRMTSTNIPNISPEFEQTYAYDQIGNLAWQSYPMCLNAECVNSGAQRPWTASYAYTKGALTSVGGGAGEGNTTAGTYATSLTYNINGTLASVTHRNSVIDQEAMDPNNIQRARQISATRNGNLIFDTGVYSYDGSRNISRIGADWYLYDSVNRLKEGTALLGGDPLKRLKQQYDYDIAGNRTTTRTYNNVGLASGALKDTYTSNVNLANNRLSLKHDDAGNVQGMNDALPIYGYDAFNMITTVPGLTYLYGPNEERFWIIDTKQDTDNANNEEIFTLRGLNNEVLREYKVVGGNAVGHWQWQKDYVYRGAKLLAAETSGNGRLHYHLDHLGSPRVITDAGGAAWERLQFLPFGENSGYYQNGEYWNLSYIGAIAPTRLRFTGHEKDSDVLGLVYMHARHYWERNGRFMSLDPVGDWDLSQPQSWNLYSYTRNNPVNVVDPTGRAGEVAFNFGGGKWLEGGVRFKRDDAGDLELGVQGEASVSGDVLKNPKKWVEFSFKDGFSISVLGWGLKSNPKEGKGEVSLPGGSIKMDMKPDKAKTGASGDYEASLRVGPFGAKATSKGVDATGGKLGPKVEGKASVSGTAGVNASQLMRRTVDVINYGIFRAVPGMYPGGQPTSREPGTDQGLRTVEQQLRGGYP